MSGRRVPVWDCASQELTAMRSRMATNRAPTTPAQPAGLFDEHQLGLLAYGQPVWPPNIFEVPLAYPLAVLIERKTEEVRAARQVDSRIDRRTARCVLELSELNTAYFNRETIASMLRELPAQDDAPLEKPPQVFAGGVARVETCCPPPEQRGDPVPGRDRAADNGSGPLPRP